MFTPIRTITRFAPTLKIECQALESKLEERGAVIDKAPNWQPKVVTSERLITGQNPKCAAGVGEAVAKANLVRSQWQPFQRSPSRTIG